MKTILKAATLVALAIPGIANAQAAGSILTVDVERVFRDCNACKVASTQLNSQAQQLQTYASQLGTPLKTEAEGIQKALAGKSPDAADAATKARIQSFQTREQQANQQLQTRQQTLQATAQNVRRQISEKLGPIFNSVLTQRKAALVVDLNSTLASAPTIDVTPDVLAQLNAQLPTISVTAPAPSAQNANVGR